MKTRFIRPHGLPLPNANTVIALLEHIFQTIKMALSRIGCQRPVGNSVSLHKKSDQDQLEATLSLVYKDWIDFIALAQDQCTRARPIKSSPTSRYRPNEPDIDEKTSCSGWVIPAWQQPSSSLGTEPTNGVQGQISPGSSPKTIQSPSRSRSFIPSTNAANIRGMIVQLYVLVPYFCRLSGSTDNDHRLIPDADGNKEEPKDLCTSCTVSYIKFATEDNSVIVKLQSQDQKMTFYQKFCRNYEPLAKHLKGGNAVSLSCDSTYEDLRIVHAAQEPHPDGGAYYIFQNENCIYFPTFKFYGDLEELTFSDSYDFQSEVLHWRFPGRKVIYSAETQHIEHTKNKSSHLQILRILQDIYETKSIVYWATNRPDLTGGKEDFVEWPRKGPPPHLAR